MSHTTGLQYKSTLKSKSKPKVQYNDLVPLKLTSNILAIVYHSKQTRW